MKYIGYTTIFIGALFCLGCSIASTPQAQLQYQVDAVEENSNIAQQEIVETNPALLPEIALKTAYDQAMTTSTYAAEFNPYSASGQPIYVHAQYLADHLNLDYEQLAVVQYQTGTYGLQTLLLSMDQTIPAVSAATAVFQDYHAADEASYYQTHMPAGLDAQDQAEFIVHHAYAQYSIFYTDVVELNSMQQNTVNQINSLSGLPEEELALLEDQFVLQSILYILPDDLSYKTQVISIVKQEYQ